MPCSRTGPTLRDGCLLCASRLSRRTLVDGRFRLLAPLPLSPGYFAPIPVVVVFTFFLVSFDGLCGFRDVSEKRVTDLDAFANMDEDALDGLGGGVGVCVKNRPLEVREHQDMIRLEGV